MADTDSTPTDISAGAAAAPGAEAAPAEQATTTPQEGATQQTAEQILDGLGPLTTAQIEALDSGDPKRIAEVLGVEPEKKEDAAGKTGDGENKSGSTTEGDKGTPEKEKKEGAGTDDEPANAPTRVSLKSLPEADRKALLAALSDTRGGKPIQESLAAHFKLTAAAEAAKPEAKTGEKTDESAETKTAAEPVKSEKVQALEAEVEAIQTDLKKAQGAFDYDKTETLRDALLEKKVELIEAKREATSQQTESARWETAENASRDAVMEKYALHFTDPDSIFSDLLNGETERAQKAKDPIFNSPDWPEKIAARVFDKNKKHLTDANSAKEEENTTVPPAPNNGVRKPGAPVGGGANSQTLTASAAFSEFDKLSPEEQQAVLNRLDNTVV